MVEFAAHVLLKIKVPIIVLFAQLLVVTAGLSFWGSSQIFHGQIDNILQYVCAIGSTSPKGMSNFEGRMPAHCKVGPIVTVPRM